jgi:hypothetical protein
MTASEAKPPRLTEILGIEETPEGRIRHLQFLREKAESRIQRGRASEAMERDHIARIDDEIATIERGV